MFRSASLLSAGRALKRRSGGLCQSSFTTSSVRVATHSGTAGCSHFSVAAASSSSIRPSLGCHTSSHSRIPLDLLELTRKVESVRFVRKKSNSAPDTSSSNVAPESASVGQVPAPVAEADAPAAPTSDLITSSEVPSGSSESTNNASEAARSDDEHDPLASMELPDAVPVFMLQARKPILPGQARVIDGAVFKELGLGLERGLHVAVFMPRDAPSPHSPLRPDTYALQVADPARIQNVVGVLAHVTDGTDGVTLSALNRCVVVRSLPPSEVAASSSAKVNHATVEVLQDFVSTESVTTTLNRFTGGSVQPLAGAQQEIAELMQQIHGMMKQLNRVYNLSMLDPALLTNPSAFSDLVFETYCIPLTDSIYMQDFLDTTSIPRRLRRVKDILTRHVDTYQKQQQAVRAQEEKLMKQQQKVLLMEQLRQVKGEGDERETLIARFNDRLKELVVPKDAMKVIQDEMSKLMSTETQSSEFGVIRSYLELLTQLPWGKFCPEKLDIAFASEVLQTDHYGLHDVKQRIMEFISVAKLHGSTQGKILCFVGPPGVGKTSIGKSVARALGRPFYRFSVGGAHDISEFKGHRRTYVGAMCGKIMQALKLTRVSNPVLMIDELDKLGRGGFHGDPASVLLEILDPEQNNSFVDHYVDIPYDLSKVLFLCTANTLETLPVPLLDRMEIIKVEGYAEEEKLQIARHYLLPDVSRRVGLPVSVVNFTDAAVQFIITHYAREPGVRNLKKKIEKIYDQIAYYIVTYHNIGEPPVVSSSSSTATMHERTLADVLDARIPPSLKRRPPPQIRLPPVLPPSASLPQSTGSSPPPLQATVLGEPIQITEAEVPEYLGPWRETLLSTVYNPPPPGVALGLAVSQIGSSLLPVEVVVDRTVDAKAESRLRITGSLGEVLKESVYIAYTFAKNFLSQRYPDEKYLHNVALHVHLPEGATPKDGPSAGVTLVTALISLALGKPIRRFTAMTGEVNLHGYILPIGGVKQKLMAAKREGMQVVLFPKLNKKNYDELDELLKQGVQVHFVNHYSEVFNIVFEGGDGNTVSPALPAQTQPTPPPVVQSPPVVVTASTAIVQPTPPPVTQQPIV